MSETAAPLFAPPQTVRMVVGKERQFQFRVTDRATVTGLNASGAALNVPAWTSFRFMAKVHAADADGSAVVTKTLGSGITKVSPTEGLLQVVLAPADTNTLADIRQSFFAEFQGSDGAGLVWTLWQGGLDLLPAVIAADT